MKDLTAAAAAAAAAEEEGLWLSRLLLLSAGVLPLLFCRRDNE